MAVKPWTPEKRAELHAAIAAEFSSAPPPRFVNTENVSGIDRPVLKRVRGITYEVRPLPFERGWDLHALMIRHTCGGDAETMRQVYRDLVALFPRLVIPCGFRRWIRWALPNPFRNASEKEIIALADFFWTCRTGRTFPAWLAWVVSKLPSTRSTTSTNSNGRTAGAPPPGATTPTG